MSASGGLFYDRYHTSGSEEWMMRVGPTDGPAILFLPPLLEEMNRTRAFLATTMRLLARQGFGCWLPDLPGTGESARALETCGWEEWRQAARDAAFRVKRESGNIACVAGVRGGVLLGGGVEAACTWRFAPVDGASLARDLVRASMLKADEVQAEELNLAGYRLSNAMFTALQGATAGDASPLRTVRLASDRGEADLKVEGPALWRRSEPANSHELAALIASDITTWVRQCGAC